MSDARTPAEAARALHERDIERVLRAYCRAIDRCDEELLRSVYHDDAYDDHGAGFRGPATEYVPWVLALLRDRFVTTSHSLSNAYIELEGNAARVESYVTAHHVVAGDEDVQMCSVFGGRYVDRFERRPSVGWRIARRTVVAEWQYDLPMRPRAEIAAGMVRGSRDRTDPSYLERLS